MMPPSQKPIILLRNFVKFSEVNTATADAGHSADPPQQTIQENEPSPSENAPSQNAQDDTNQQIDVNPKFAPSEPIYDWKDITQEFFESVKGKCTGAIDIY